MDINASTFRDAARKFVVEGCTCEPGTGNGTRVRVMNPATGRGFLCSTDQSAQGRPEWIFFKMTEEEESLMVSCAAVITKYNGNSTNPRDLETFTFVPFEEAGHEQTLIARVLAADDELIAPLRHCCFGRELPHGAIAVFPVRADLADVVAAAPERFVREILDGTIRSEILDAAELAEAVRKVLGRRGRGRGRGRRGS
jgi:hypothetical protein